MNMSLASTVFSGPSDKNRLTILQQATLVFAGTVLIALSSKLQVPFYPVPMTLQTLAILTIGMAYGWWLATATMILYLLQGVLGFPVFAGTPEKGIGLAYMLGGTGGYLIGFVFAAAACGWLAERGWDRHFLTTGAAMIIGNMLIYLPGLLWLGVLYGWDKPIVQWGLLPFVLGDVVKVALGACLMPMVWKLMRSR